MVTIAYVALGLLGAIFGSFASALIPRMREKRNMSHERSACPSCGHTLGVLDLFPILSFALLGGKCRYCKAKIPAYHFLLECLMVAVFLSTGVYLVDLHAVLEGSLIELVRLAILLVSGFVTVVFTVYDLLYMEIPDEVMLPAIATLFALVSYDHFAHVGLFGYYMPMASAWFHTPLANGLLGSAIIFSFFLFQILVSKGAWMGGGDLRIALFMGLVAGTKMSLLGLFLAYMIGSVIGVGIIAVKRSRNIAVPFGPYLAAGLYVSLFFHEPILRWYFGLIGI